jgi:hypothetical protein
MKRQLTQLSRLLLSSLGIAGLSIAGTQPVKAITVQDIVKCPYGTPYNLVWDGWQGTLLFFSNPQTNYLYAFGNTYQVRYQLHNSQDIVWGYRAPGYRGTQTAEGYRIVFWVDFNKTPSNPNDDQMFDGYLMTQTKKAIAGVTWWNNLPFGFYAEFPGINYCPPG